jgi:hypothetical protein
MQIEVPLPAEPVSMPIAEIFPPVVEPFRPRHQCSIVVSRESVPIFNLQLCSTQFGQFTGQRKITVGEDVLQKPQYELIHAAIGCPTEHVAGNDLQAENSSVYKAVIDGLKKPRHVSSSHRFDHLDRDNAIELLGKISIILNSDVDGKVYAPFGSYFGLFTGYGDASDMYTMLGRSVMSKVTPAAPNVQDPHARPKIEFLTHQFKLGFLRRV